MNIIKATPADLVEVLYLLRVCVQDMNDKGWFHWDLQNHLVKNDIEKGTVFLYRQNDVCLGAITINNEEIAELKEVQWMSSAGNPLFIHRLLVHPFWKGKGVAESLISFAEQFVVEMGGSSLRLEVYSENKEAIHLFSQRNYKQTGEILLLYQKSWYYCFEKCF